MQANSGMHAYPIEDIASDTWPPLPYVAWHKTKDTLHMYLQVIGKVRLACSPTEPQWSNVTLYLTARGLTTSPMRMPHGAFDINLDFVEHKVVIARADGECRWMRLRSQPVAHFQRELFSLLDSLGIHVDIRPVPAEVPDPIPFQLDFEHATYIPTWAARYWRILSNVDLVLKQHRARFRGRTSPVHLFWGSMDLVYSRYSGRAAEAPEGSDFITRIADDAEYFSVGFWPGDSRFAEPAFFAYAFPQLPDVEHRSVAPRHARWDPRLRLFLLRYEDVRRSPNPTECLLRFAQSTYLAATAGGGWDPALDHDVSAR